MDITHNKILMLSVEREIADQELLRQALKEFPFQIDLLTACNIQEVLTRVKGKTKPDVVIADFRLEDGSAIDLIRMCEEVPVIVGIDSSNTADSIQALREGAFNYFIKDEKSDYLNLLPLIVEKAIAKKLITDNERLLSSVVKNISDAVIIINTADEIVFVNPAFTIMYGYSESEIVGNNVDFLVAVDLGTDKLNWKVNRSNERLHQRKDGELLHVIETVSELQAHNEYADYRIVLVRDISDRVAIQQSLAATEVRLDGVLSSIDDVVYSMLADTREILYVNKATEIVFGMSEDDFKVNTASWKKFVHGGDLYKLDLASISLQKKGYAEAEYRLITPKGNIKWLRDRAWIVETPGTPKRIDGIITDISERKFAEQAYRDSEERYRTAIQSSVEAIYMMNPASYAVLDVNEAFCNLLGYSRSEALQLKMTDFVSHDISNITRYIDNVLGDGKSILDKRHWRHKNGSILTVEITANKIVQRDQEIVFVVARDVTAQSHIKRQLDDERELLREVVANAPVPMAIFDSNLRFLIYSKSWVQAYGPRRPKLIGEKLFDVYENLPVAWRELCVRGVAGEVLHVAEEELVGEGGESIYLRLAVHPWGSSDNSRNGIILVAERIDELVNARKSAEDANIAKSAFLARITHELRTPLNAILGYSQIMMNDAELANMHKGYVENMYSSGNHLLNMINDILDISKIEASRMELHIEPVNLHEIVRDIYEMFRLKVASKGIELMVTIDPGVDGAVKLDRSKFSQVLINLIGNAVKFTETGSVEVNISVDSEEKPKVNEQILSIEVRDTGRGIPEEDIHLIFEPFQQASNSDVKGTGLGLAITKRIINLMSGELNVQSTLGEGAVFSFKVPVELDEELHIQKSDQFSKVKSITSHNPLKVLVVDDVELNRTVVRLLLERIGAKISEAENGAVAVEMFNNSHFDVIIMDIIMPVMDGVKAMSAIRNSKSEKKVPIIALTASGFDDKRESLINAGFNEYILKPFKESDLLRALSEHASVQYVFREELKTPYSLVTPENLVVNCVRLIKDLPENLTIEIKNLIYIQDVDGLITFRNEKLGETKFGELATIIDKVTAEYDLYFMTSVSKRLKDF